MELIKAYNHVYGVISTSGVVVAGMTRLCDIFKEGNEDVAWDNILSLDYEADYKKQLKWLENLYKEDPPGKDVCILSFGTFEAYDDESEESCFRLYLSGNTEYDPNDEEGGIWACDPPYFPEMRYADSEIMKELHKIAEKSNEAIFELIDCYISLGYAGLLAVELCKSECGKLMLGERDMIHVSVGQDEGTYDVIGEIRKDGWHSKKE